jgi:hypothetical protein
MTDYMLAKYYKRAFLVALGLFLAAVAWIAFGPHQQQPQPSIVEKHDTLWRDTTLHHPTPSASVNTGRTIFIPYIMSEPDTIEAHDTLLVEVPIEQKRYDDSLYTAWVSGYEPALDSIRLHQPEVVTTITRTITKPAPRWSIGPSVGAGISITGQQQAGIFVGITAQYRLWPK